MQRMSEEGFKKFLVFLASCLDENKDLLKLVQKRYDECDDTFCTSTDFQDLLDDVQSKIEIEKHRVFVHLKDFLSKLKSHRIEKSPKKRKRDDFCNILAKRLCTANSCSDVSSDSDFFKKVKKINNSKVKNDVSSVKSNSPKDIDASSDSPLSSTDKKTDKTPKIGMGKSSDKPWTISDEESISLDSVRSDTKSSDNSDLPLYSNSKFLQEPESVSVDSVSSESKCSKPLSENAETATKLSGNQVSGAVPSPHVVIDDGGFCSELSLPSPRTPLDVNETKNEVSLENADTVENENEDTSVDNAKELKKKKGSERQIKRLEKHVIDDGGFCSELSLPSPRTPLNVNETKNEVRLENADTVENENTSIDNAEELKKKKGSERQIKRLEKLLEDIRDEIENVSKKELSIEDMEKDDSSYVYEDRLQKKFIKVWAKICELKNQDTSTGRPIEKKFRFSGTRYAEINKRIEKFINKKKIFPDYNDIKKIITQVNTHYNLYLGKSAIEDLAREAFTDVGNQLQERRHRNFILTFGNSQTDVCSVTEDPALYHQELRKKLDENRKLAKNRLDEVISKYAKKQYETNAQPEEVDENAPDSSSDEEEEETPDIPELDEVMAISDEDEDEVSEIPKKSLSDGNKDEVSVIPRNSAENSGMPLTKNLKIQIEKLAVPATLLKKKQVPSPSIASCPSSTVATRQNVNRNDAVAIVAVPNTGLKPLPSHTATKMSFSKQKSVRCLDKSQDCKAASNEVVIDLDSSSDADDSAEIIGSTDPNMKQALVPFKSRFPTSTVNSNKSNMSLNSSSSSSSTMVMSSQNSMQFSMQVKTQYQQQQKDGFSLKIASVSSLAYSIKDTNSNRQYFTSQQTNYQNQDFHLTPGSTCKRISNKARLPPVPSNSVIVLSDSD